MRCPRQTSAAVSACASALTLKYESDLWVRHDVLRGAGTVGGGGGAAGAAGAGGAALPLEQQPQQPQQQPQQHLIQAKLTEQQQIDAIRLDMH